MAGLYPKTEKKTLLSRKQVNPLAFHRVKVFRYTPHGFSAHIKNDGCHFCVEKRFLWRSRFLIEAMILYWY